MFEAVVGPQAGGEVVGEPVPGCGISGQVSVPEGGAGGEQAGVEDCRLAKYRKHAGFGLAGLAGEIQVVAAAEDEQIFVGPSQAGWCVAVGQLAVGGADVGAGAGCRRV